jgi:hypothetical protein
MQVVPLFRNEPTYNHLIHVKNFMKTITFFHFFCLFSCELKIYLLLLLVKMISCSITSNREVNLCASITYR